MQHATETPDRAGIVAAILAAVFALVIGAAVAFVTSFTYREVAPWGLVAGLAVVGALVLGFRLVFESRLIALAGALGVIAVIALTALPGTSGESVLKADALGWAWLVGSAVVAGAAIGVPPLGRAKAVESSD